MRANEKDGNDVTLSCRECSSRLVFVSYSKQGLFFPSRVIQLVNDNSEDNNDHHDSNNDNSEDSNNDQDDDNSDHDDNNNDHDDSNNDHDDNNNDHENVNDYVKQQLKQHDIDHLDPNLLLVALSTANDILTTSSVCCWMYYSQELLDFFDAEVDAKGLDSLMPGAYIANYARPRRFEV